MTEKKLLNIFLWLCIVALMVGIMFDVATGEPLIAPPESPTYKVIVVNNIPGSELGLAQFIEVNGKQEVKILNMRWTEHIRVLNLEIGHYGITQIKKTSIYIGGAVGTIDTISYLNFKQFKVLNKGITVKMGG